MILPVIGLGLSFGCFICVFFPSLTLITTQQNLPLVYGIASSAVNTGSTLTPILVGYIHDETY